MAYHTNMKIGECDRMEVRLCIPQQYHAEAPAELKCRIFGDMLSIISDDTKKDAIIFGTEPEHDPELAGEYVQIAQIVLAGMGLDIPLEIADMTEEAAQQRAEIEAQQAEQEEGFKQFIAEVLGTIEEGLPEATKAEQCGCPICQMRRKAIGIEEPTEYAPGLEPEKVRSEMDDEDWLKADEFHAMLVNAGQLEAGPKPSAIYRGLN